MKEEQFSHPTMHVINAASQCVIWSERFAATAWLADRTILAKGEAQYQVVNQQLGVHHYYVWVEILK